MESGGEGEREIEGNIERMRRRDGERGKEGEKEIGRSMGRRREGECERESDIYM